MIDNRSALRLASRNGDPPRVPPGARLSCGRPRGCRGGGGVRCDIRLRTTADRVGPVQPHAMALRAGTRQRRASIGIATLGLGQWPAGDLVRVVGKAEHAQQVDRELSVAASMAFGFGLVVVSRASTLSTAPLAQRWATRASVDARSGRRPWLVTGPAGRGAGPSGAFMYRGPVRWWIFAICGCAFRHPHGHPRSPGEYLRRVVHVGGQGVEQRAVLLDHLVYGRVEQVRLCSRWTCRAHRASPGTGASNLPVAWSGGHTVTCLSPCRCSALAGSTPGDRCRW